MKMVKAFAFAVVIAFSLDAFFFDGDYRRDLGRGIIATANAVSSSNWHGLNGD